MHVLLAFIDVGQGDSTVMVDRESGLALVVDCPGGQAAEVERVLAAEGVSEVDAVFVTHSDWDHLGGVFELTQWLVVRELRFNLDTLGSTSEDRGPRLRAALRAFGGLEDQGVDLAPAYAGDTGAVGCIGWEALAPTHGQLARAHGIGNRNRSSVILRLFADVLTALIAGDADGAAWRRVLDSGKPVRSLVFRLPHHGAAMPGGAGAARLGEVLDAVGAEYHVISVGADNSYGHPHPTTLEELRQRVGRARLMCTEVNTVCLGSRALPTGEARCLPPVCQTHCGFRPGGAPCAGTISFELRAGALNVVPSIEEQRVVTDALEMPMSRP